MAVYWINIPDWCPVRINQWRGRHWSVRAKLVRQQVAMIGTYALLQGVPLAKGKRKVRLCVWKPGQSVDSDAYTKDILDALVQCRLLVDDSDKWLGGLEVIVTKDKQK